MDILVNNAGMYYPMSLDEGPNKGQGPLDGVFGASSLEICQCILFSLHTVGNVCCSRSFSTGEAMHCQCRACTQR